MPQRSMVQDLGCLNALPVPEDFNQGGCAELACSMPFCPSSGKWLRSSANLGSTVSRCGEPERPPQKQHPWPDRHAR